MREELKCKDCPIELTAHDGEGPCEPNVDDLAHKMCDFGEGVYVTNDRWMDVVCDLGCLLHQGFQVDKDTIETLRSARLEDVEKAIEKEKKALTESCKKSTKHW